MNVEALILIRVDYHVVAPPGLFDNPMTQAELDTIAPRLLAEHGPNFWLYECHPLSLIPLS